MYFDKHLLNPNWLQWNKEILTFIDPDFNELSVYLQYSYKRSLKKAIKALISNKGLCFSLSPLKFP